MFEILRAKLRKIKRRTKQIHLFLCRDAVTSPTCWQSYEIFGFFLIFYMVTDVKAVLK